MNGRFFGVLAAMAALLLAGLSTGTRIYYYLFFVCLLMLLYSIASVLWTLFTVKIGMKGMKARVLRGDRLMTILTVEHRSLFPAGSLRVRLNTPTSTGVQEISVAAPPFAKRSFRNVVRCPHRGNFDVGVARIAAGDVFGFFDFSRKYRGKLVRVEVCPRSAPASAMELRAIDFGPEFRARAAEDNASPSDTRKWQEGDELKKVHWKLSLRKREVMVRTFEESARPDTLILPDLSEITALQDQRLTLEDWICEEALGAAEAQLKAGYPVRMPLRSRRPQELAGRTAAELASFAEALMRVDFDSPYPYEQVLSLMLGRMQRTGGAILVTSRLSSRIADVAMRMQRSGMQVKFIWISDAPREENLEMLERMKMANVLVQWVNPWTQESLTTNADQQAKSSLTLGEI